MVNALDPASGLGLPTGLGVFGCDVRCPLPPLFPRVGGGILIIEALTTPPSPVVGGGQAFPHQIPQIHLSRCTQPACESGVIPYFPPPCLGEGGVDIFPSQHPHATGWPLPWEKARPVRFSCTTSTLVDVGQSTLQIPFHKTLVPSVVLVPMRLRWNCEKTYFSPCYGPSWALQGPVWQTGASEATK